VAVIHLLDPDKKRLVEQILERQYSYISDEQERKRKLAETLSKSEEEILRRIPLQLRQRIVNMRKDPKSPLNQMTQGKWLGHPDKNPEASMYVSSFKNSIDPDTEQAIKDNFSKAIHENRQLTAYDVRFASNDDKHYQVVERKIQW